MPVIGTVIFDAPKTLDTAVVLASTGAKSDAGIDLDDQ